MNNMIAKIRIMLALSVVPLIGAGLISCAKEPAPLSSVRLPEEGDLVEHWLSLDWDDLNAEEKKLWSVLGWNQARWDEEPGTAEPDSELKNWADLSTREKAAASLLGFSQPYWDGIVDQQ